MVTSCVVGGCSKNYLENSYNPHRVVSLHQWPTDPVIAAKWKQFVESTRKGWSGPTSTTTICGEHFRKPDDFVGYQQWQMGYKKKLDLVPNAIPSIRPIMTNPRTTRGARNEPIAKRRKTTVTKLNFTRNILAMKQMEKASELKQLCDGATTHEMEPSIDTVTVCPTVSACTTATTPQVYTAPTFTARSVQVQQKKVKKPKRQSKGKKSDDPLHPDYIPSLFSFTPTADRMRAVNNLQTYLQSKELSENRNSSKGIATTMLLNLHQIKEEAETAFPVKEEAETVFPVKEEAETAFPVKEEDGTVFPVKKEDEMTFPVKLEVEATFSIGGEVESVFIVEAGDEGVHSIRDDLQTVQDTAVQTEERHYEISSLHDQVKSLSSECQSLRDTVHKLESELKRRTLDPSNFDDSKMKIFTGLPNLQTFTLAFCYTSSVVHVTEKQSLKPTQELLLTLMKLHNNLSEKFLGHLFGVHQSTVSRIFRRWIKAMASRLPDSEFPQLKAAISQHLLPPSPVEGANEGVTSTPLQVLCVRTGQLSNSYSTLQTSTGQNNTRKLLSTPITSIKDMHSPSSSTAYSTFPSNAPPSLL